MNLLKEVINGVDVVRETKKRLLEWSTGNIKVMQGADLDNMKKFNEQVEKASTPLEIMKAVGSLNLVGYGARVILLDMFTSVRSTLSDFLRVQTVLGQLDGLIEVWSKKAKKHSARDRQRFAVQLIKVIEGEK